MSDDTLEPLAIQDIRPANADAARTWSNGGHAYDEISRQIADAIEHGVDRLDPRPGQRILDIATGTGWAARRIAGRGAHVTGVDFGADVIEAARRIGTCDRLEFVVGDAEDLPFPDETFDGVISTFGVMFCGDPEGAAAELARVCKPGGRLALTNWAATGTVRAMFELIQRYRPAPQTARLPSPFDWGRRECVHKWLGTWFDLGFEDAISYCRAKDGAAVWEAFAAGFGPVVTLSRQLSRATLAQFRAEFERFHDRFRTDAGVLVERSYVVAVGERVA